MRERTSAWKSEALLAACAGLLLTGLFAMRQVGTWRDRLRYPGEENFNEGRILAEMLHLRQGMRIYDRLGPDQFETANFGPLFYLLGARLVSPEKRSHLPLRIVSLFATLGCAVACGLLAFWLSQSYTGAVVGGLLFLSVGMVTFYGVSARSDLLALFLSFTGFLVAWRFQNKWRILLGIPFMLLAIFYKQHFIAAPLAVMCFLAAQKRYRLAAWFAGLMGLGGLALLVLFEFAVFPGQALLTHLLRYNMLPFAWEPLHLGLNFFGVVLTLPLVLAVVYLRLYPHGLLSFYLACTVVLTLVMFAKEGSDANYTFECLLLSLSLSAALFGTTLAAPRRAALLLAPITLWLTFAGWRAPAAPQPSDFARDLALQGYLREHFAPGTPGLSLYTGDLIRAGLDAPLPDIYTYSWLIREGTVPASYLVDELHRKRYGVIMLNFDLEHETNRHFISHYLTAALRRAILADYRVADTLPAPAPETIQPAGLFYIWIPRVTNEKVAVR